MRPNFTHYTPNAQDHPTARRALQGRTRGRVPHRDNQPQPDQTPHSSIAHCALNQNPGESPNKPAAWHTAGRGLVTSVADRRAPRMVRAEPYKDVLAGVSSTEITSPDRIKRHTAQQPTVRSTRIPANHPTNPPRGTQQGGGWLPRWRTVAHQGWCAPSPTGTYSRACPPPR